MFCYACMFDLVVLDLIFICNGLLCIFCVFFCVSLDHFRFVICNLVLLGLVFLSTKPRDWLGKTSPKWPISCEVGRKILHSSAKYTAAYITRYRKKSTLTAPGPCNVPSDRLHALVVALSFILTGRRVVWIGHKCLLSALKLLSSRTGAVNLICHFKIKCSTP